MAGGYISLNKTFFIKQYLKTDACCFINSLSKLELTRRKIWYRRSRQELFFFFWILKLFWSFLIYFFPKFGVTLKVYDNQQSVPSKVTLCVCVCVCVCVCECQYCEFTIPRFLMEPQQNLYRIIYYAIWRLRRCRNICMEKNTFHKYLSEFQFIFFIPFC